MPFLYHFPLIHSCLYKWSVCLYIAHRKKIPRCHVNIAYVLVCNNVFLAVLILKNNIVLTAQKILNGSQADDLPHIFVR